MTILYIDDDPDARFLLQQLLEEAPTMTDAVQLRLLEASGFDDAVDEHGTVQIDGILLDNRLGAIDGVDLLPALRNTWSCPVWMLTGVASQELLDRCKANGAAGVLLKDQLMRDPEAARGIVLQSFDAPR